MPEAARVELLGRFRVSVGARTIEEDEWKLRKATSLVKMLALEPDHRLHRERAMDLMWPELNAEAAANNLRYMLHVARRTLKPASSATPHYLQLRGEQLVLCPDSSLWVDAEAFADAATMARRSREPAAYRAALDLYVGDLLPDDPYESWVEERREGLRLTYLALLVELAGLHEERNEFESAVEMLRKVVAAEPTHEGAHAGLMRLYIRTGQRRQSLRQYERLRQAFLQELGTEPDKDTQRLYQEIVAGRTLSAEPPSAGSPLDEEPTNIGGRHNLPRSLTSFVGREREVVEVEQLLSTTRLLTLTGTGGSGKTRLALEIAKDLVEAYPDGVWLVELAPLAEGALVPQAVAAALSVSEQPDRSLTDTLVDTLRTKQMFLVLDNCEHLVEATAHLTEALLGACPGLRILTTSRELLGGQNETTWSVPPLSGPEPRYRHAVEEIEGYEAVRLFVERARSRHPAFVLTSENAQAVAEVCQRLEGMPLAIELATARVGMLTVAEISERLRDSLKLLTGSSRTATRRQRTLRGALDWSHELLTESERMMFRRMSAFAGGWTLESAEAVGAGDGIEEGDVLDLLSRLVVKSLVVTEATGDGGVRFRMLEPVRQYAWERLVESEEGDAVRRRHAEFFLGLAEEAEPELMGPRHGAWLERLEREHDNLRVALSWSLERGETELGLRFGGTLGGFWGMIGHLQEGRRWLEAALVNRRVAPVGVRAKAVSGAGRIAWEQGDYEQAQALSEEGLELFRELGDTPNVAATLSSLGWAALFNYELERASALLEEAIALQRALGDTVSLVRTLPLLGMVAAVQHDYERAAALHEEGLALSRRIEDKLGISMSLGQMAIASLIQGSHEQTRVLCGEGLELSRRLKATRITTAHLQVLAASIGAQRRSVHTARLWGAAEGLREAIGTVLAPVERYVLEPYIAAARAQVDEAAWETALAEGKAMTLEQAVEYALSKEESTLITTPMPEETSVDRQPSPLTRREEEVAVLIARGMTNRQISEELSLSERTVHRHVGKILKKLELRSRAQIAVWVAERRPVSSSPD